MDAQRILEAAAGAAVQTCSSDRPRETFFLPEKNVRTEPPEQTVVHRGSQQQSQYPVYLPAGSTVV